MLFVSTNAVQSSSGHGIQSTLRDDNGSQLFTVDSLNDNPEDDWRKTLPSGLRNRDGAPLHRIEMNGAVIYLLGTSHVSRSSCDDARLLMQHVRPGA